MKDILFAAAGYVAGAFTPAIGRKIKALFSKESAAAVSTVTTAVAKKL
jgi:hypothetical protein